MLRWLGDWDKNEFKHSHPHEICPVYFWSIEVRAEFKTTSCMAQHKFKAVFLPKVLRFPPIKQYKDIVLRFDMLNS